MIKSLYIKRNINQLGDITFREKHTCPIHLMTLLANLLREDKNYSTQEMFFTDLVPKFKHHSTYYLGDYDETYIEKKLQKLKDTYLSDFDYKRVMDHLEIKDG